jgi:hypothetical protein
MAFDVRFYHTISLLITRRRVIDIFLDLDWCKAGRTFAPVFPSINVIEPGVNTKPFSVGANGLSQMYNVHYLK